MFKTEKFTERITRIYLPGAVFAYLIEGTTEAALIDTGCGIGDLKSFVDTLTKKPVTVLLSHGHLDHAPGAPEFDRVYMNSSDRQIFMVHNDINKRMDYAISTSDEICFTRDDFVPEKNCEQFLSMEDGMIFDLGDLHIEAISCAGHTPGSMAFLIQEERMLFLGDCCNPFVFLFDKTCLGVTSYKNNLLTLYKKVTGHYDRVLLSHGTGVPSRSMIEEAILVCDDILTGNSEEIPYTFQDRKAFLAKCTGRKNIYGEEMANIAYDKERILE